MFVPKHLCFLVFLLLPFHKVAAQQPAVAVIDVDTTIRYQTIEHFGASDAWACQFAGNWPEEKKNAMADWLFSTDTLLNGNPKGIGLSMWRYNLGAGSAEQGERSGIKDEWRRAPLTNGSSQKATAQNWFLQAAKRRGVQEFLGFFNSSPVQFTRNGKAYAEKGKTNIDSSKYHDFAAYTVAAINQVKQATGITFDYLSPVNEPQWDWSDGNQEGCPYTNAEISGLIKSFSRAFQQNAINTRLVITEAGQHTYLLPGSDKPGKGDQVNHFFNSASQGFVGNLPNVSPTIASHSYFTTSPMDSALSLRGKLKNTIQQTKNLRLWQSEYCILGDNAGEIKGEKKDLGMNAALYLAKVVYQDLIASNATAWHWWTALSAYDYKDGLVYIEKKETDGNFSDSKMLWALGNYSYFVRPGMQRVAASSNDKELLVSAFRDDRGKVVVIIVNPTNQTRSISFKQKDMTVPGTKPLATYTTSATGKLQKSVAPAGNVVVASKAVISIVID